MSWYVKLCMQNLELPNSALCPGAFQGVKCSLQSGCYILLVRRLHIFSAQPATICHCWQLNKYSGVFAIAQRKGVTVKAEKARKGLSAATFSNTQHICNSFCRINQTNWLPANTLIGLTNCEIEEKVEGNFWGQLGSWSSPFVANESLEMMKSRKSQRILRHIQGNEG